MAAGAGFLHKVPATIIYLRGFARVPAATGSILSYAEIAFGLAWGAWFFAEPVTIEKLIGAGVMIVNSSALTGAETVERPEGASRLQ